MDEYEVEIDWLSRSETGDNFKLKSQASGLHNQTTSPQRFPLPLSAWTPFGTTTVTDVSALRVKVLFST